MSDYTTQLIAALPEFVTADPEARPGLAKPFAVEYEGARWAVATDGCRLLAVRGDHGYPLWSEAGAPDAALVMERPKAEAVSVSIAALREFAGVPTDKPEPCQTCDGEERVACDECDGEGTEGCTCHCGDEHDRDCDECDGFGTLPCPDCSPHKSRQRRPALVGSAVFCRNVIGRAVAPLPDVPATWAQDSDDRMARIDGDGWFVVLMPMRKTGLERDIPRFDLAGVHA